MPGLLDALEAEARSELSQANPPAGSGAVSMPWQPGLRDVIARELPGGNIVDRALALPGAIAAASPLGDLLAGARMGRDALGSTAALLTGDERTAQDLQASVQAIEDAAQVRSDMNPLAPPVIPRLVRGAARSLTETAPAAALGGVPAAIAAGMIQGGAGKYLERRALGEDERSALYAALRQAGYEGLPAAIMQRLGLGGAETVLADAFRRGGMPLVREVITQGMRAGVHEVPEELATTAAELADTAATTDVELSPAEVAQQLAETAGTAFLAPNLVTPVRVAQIHAARQAAEAQAQETAKAASAAAALRREREALEQVLAEIPDAADPGARIRPQAQPLSSADRAALQAAAVETPPSAAGLDPAADAAPMPQVDPLLDLTPTEVGKLARADRTTPPTQDVAGADTTPFPAALDAPGAPTRGDRPQTRPEARPEPDSAQIEPGRALAGLADTRPTRVAHSGDAHTWRLPPRFAALRPRVDGTAIPFDSDLDRAAYTVATDKPGERRDALLAAITEGTGLTPGQVFGHGRRLVESVGRIRDGRGGVPIIPAQRIAGAGLHTDPRLDRPQIPSPPSVHAAAAAIQATPLSLPRVQALPADERARLRQHVDTLQAQVPEAEAVHKRAGALLRILDRADAAAGAQPQAVQADAQPQAVSMPPSPPPQVPRRAAWEEAMAAPTPAERVQRSTPAHASWMPAAPAERLRADAETMAAAAKPGSPTAQHAHALLDALWERSHPEAQRIDDRHLASIERTNPGTIEAVSPEQVRGLSDAVDRVLQHGRPGSPIMSKARALRAAIDAVRSPAPASTVTAQPEDVPHGRSQPVPADTAPAADPAPGMGSPAGTGGEPAPAGRPVRRRRGRGAGTAQQPDADAGIPAGIPVDGRGDTRPSDDHALLRLVRGEPVRVATGQSLSRLVRGHVEDETPSFTVDGATVQTPHDAAVLFAALRSPFVERTSYIITDADGRVLTSCVFSVGNIDSASTPSDADLADLLNEARTNNGKPARVYLSHNHPSGDPRASAADRRMYGQIADTCRSLGVGFTGIVTNGSRFSFTETGDPGDYTLGTYDQRQTKPWEAVPFESFQDRTGAIQITTPEASVAVAKLVQTDPGAVVVIASSGGQVAGVTVLPPKAAIYSAIMAATASHGANEVVVVGPPGTESSAFLGAPRGKGRLVDVVIYDGRTVRSLRGTEPQHWIENLRTLPPGTHRQTGTFTRAQLSDPVGTRGMPGAVSDEDSAYRAEPTAAAADNEAPQVEPQREPPAEPQPATVDTGTMLDAAGLRPRSGTESLAASAFSPLLAGRRLVGAAVDWWATPLLQRVEGQAGDAGTTLANMARKTNDRVRQLMGSANARLTGALRLMSGRNLPSRAAVRSLRSVEWVDGKDYGFSRFQRLVETGDDLSGLPPLERKMIEEYRGLVELTGDWAERAGMRMLVGKDENGEPQWAAFQRTPEGRKFIRRPTAELFDILDQPGSPEFRALAAAVADANGLPVQETTDRMREEAERAIIQRQPMESMRWLKAMPTHIRLHGRIVPLLESDPFLATQHLVRGAAMRVAYVENFGQDVENATQPSRHPAVARWVKAGGNMDDLTSLVRALNGMPLAKPGTLFAPGTPEYDGLRWYRMVMGIVKTGLLSKAAIQNVPETLGKTMAYAGGKRWLAAWAEILTNPRAAAVETARLGARTVDVANLMAQPGRTREAIERMVREIGLRVTLFHGVNELNELHAAVAGLHFARDLKAGNVSPLDHARLRLLGFTEQEAADLVQGKGTPDQLEAVATRMAEQTQGSTSLPSERSNAAHSRWWPHLVAFDAYGQFTWNRFAHMNRDLVAAGKAGDWKELARVSGLAATLYGGTAASGALALTLAALAMGGASGVRQLFEHAEGDPEDFIKDAFTNAALGGAAGSIARAVEASADEGSDLGKSLARMSLPVSLTGDLIEFAQGGGRYRDQDLDERAVTFLRGHLPITRPLATVAAMLGLSGSDPGRDSAMAAYWAWRRKHTQMASRQGKNDDEEEAHAAWRKSMRRALQALRSGNDPTDLLREALAAKAADPTAKQKPGASVAASLRGRRLLASLSDVQRVRLRADLGPTAMSKLEAWDQLLDELASRMRSETSSNGGR